MIFTCRFGNGALSAARNAARKFASTSSNRTPEQVRHQQQPQPVKRPVLQLPKLPKLPQQQQQQLPTINLPTLYPPAPTSAPTPPTPTPATTTTTTTPTPLVKLNEIPNVLPIKQQQQQQLIQLVKSSNGLQYYYYVPTFHGTLAAPSKYWTARIATP